jgi:alkanesulfonate monooxygenase SsuD/methylene tetrahydromethanopterin reductase-like flavin-dependent oxidoreductase (luciferase family)
MQKSAVPQFTTHAECRRLGDFADPRVVADTAQLAEESGWDGLFIWDHLIGYNQDLVADFAATSILLAAAALPRPGFGWAPRLPPCRAAAPASWRGRSRPWTGCLAAG